MELIITDNIYTALLLFQDAYFINPENSTLTIFFLKTLNPALPTVTTVCADALRVTVHHCALRI